MLDFIPILKVFVYFLAEFSHHLQRVLFGKHRFCSSLAVNGQIQLLSTAALGFLANFPLFDFYFVRFEHYQWSSYTDLSHLNVLSLKCPRSGFLAGYFSQLNVLSVKCPKIVIFKKLCPHFHCILSKNRDLNVRGTDSLQCIFLG